MALPDHPIFSPPHQTVKKLFSLLTGTTITAPMVVQLPTTGQPSVSATMALAAKPQMQIHPQEYVKSTRQRTTKILGDSDLGEMKSD